MKNKSYLGKQSRRQEPHADHPFGANLKGRHWLAWLLLLLPVLGAGCGSFVAHRMTQAPNTYPTWLAPSARVLLSFDENLLTNFPAQFADVGPPSARLRYRVISPAEYHLEMTSTNWLKRGKARSQYTFDAEVPAGTNAWTAAPRGTVVLLHGYGLAEFAMVPWALRLAQEGWRCVLVELRGHGQSTGTTIYFGLKEPRDLSQLLDTLAQNEPLTSPVAVLGESYGATLALRWKAMDPRLATVVAIAPYAVLSNAVLNLCQEYAPCLPRAFLKAGLKRLPTLLEAQADDLNPATVLARNPVVALFIAANEDKVTPLTELRGLFARAMPGSELITVPGATHETVPYHFSELVPPVLAWLTTNAASLR